MIVYRKVIVNINTQCVWNEQFKFFFLNIQELIVLFCLDMDPNRFCLDPEPYPSSAWIRISDDIFQIRDRDPDQNYTDPQYFWESNVGWLASSSCPVPGTRSWSAVLGTGSSPSRTCSRLKRQLAAPFTAMQVSTYQCSGAESFAWLEP